MQTHDTGQAMLKILACLIKDANHALGTTTFYSGLLKLIQANDVKAIRSYKFPDRLLAPPYVFKWDYQIEAFLKRFRFVDDMFTDDELEQFTVQKFLDVQSSLPSGRPASRLVFEVLKRVRSMVREILGPYCIERHVELCRFGTRAVRGVPLTKSYLDSRLSVPLSGSQQHKDWFIKSVLSSDKLLEDCILECQNSKEIEYNLCEHLQLSTVPKAWKSKRGIMPNTLLGNFISNGLGDYIEEQLTAFGLPISRLQEVHKVLAQKNSLSRYHCTVDWSSASDSYTSWLINMCVPRDWFRALSNGRIANCIIGDKPYKLQSFMTMGIGFTFPLQTLLFYCIIKCIGNMCNITGTYSVYGDDCIYPRKIHREVSYVFSKIGFSMNKEKTYVQSNFRESCGGDYYHGIDVRPCNPSGCQERLGWQSYSSFLYKIANGLRNRWDDCELPTTLYFIKKEICAVGYLVLQVPPSFPDDCGWKVSSPKKGVYWSPVIFRLSDGVFNFALIRSVSQRHFVSSHRPFMWDVLRCAPDEEKAFLYANSRERFQWVKVKKRLPRGKRNNLNKSFLMKLKATVARVNSGRVQRQTGRSAEWV